MYEDICDSWKSFKPQNFKGEKQELKQLIRDEITERITRCKIKQSAEILRTNKNELVELLVKCYEEAPVTKLVGCVWDAVTDDPKFSNITHLLAEIALMLEENRANIKITKISAEDERKLESLMANASKRSAAAAAKNERPKSPPKKIIRGDPRPVPSNYAPPKSIFDTATYGTAKSNNSTPSTTNGTASTASATNGTQKSTSQNGNARKVLHSTNSNYDHRIPADPSAHLIRNDISSSAAVQQHSSAKKSVEFSPFAETNRNPRVASRTMSPPPQPTVDIAAEEEDDEESEEEIHISRARDFSRYSRCNKPKQAKLPTPTPWENNQGNTDDDEDLLNSDIEDNNSVPMESQNQNEYDVNSESLYNEEEDDDFNTIKPRNLDRYNPLASTADVSSSSKNTQHSSASTNPSQPTATRRSMLDSGSDNDDVPPEPKRQKRIQFDEETLADNEHRAKRIVPDSNITVGSAIQPHYTLDYNTKVNMEGPNPTNCLIAFPNQSRPCLRPEYLVLEKWIPQTDYEDVFIPDAFSAFRNSRYMDNVAEKAPDHLFICDSMLSGIPIDYTYQKVEFIDCAHPNNPFKLIEHLENEVEEKRNDYVMKNVFICVGLDFITLDPDEKRARKNTIEFFQNFMNAIIKAFNPKGPRRYKKSNVFDKNSFLDISPPKLVFITIPRVQGPSPAVKNLNHEISKLNDSIQNFVKEMKEEAERKRCLLELYDWEAACREFDQCTETDLKKRNGILMKKLCDTYGLLMFRK